MQSQIPTFQINILRNLLVPILFVSLHSLDAAPLPRILVLSETNGWDHQTRTVADSVIRSMGNEHGFEVTVTGSTDGYFTEEYLSTCAAVCFINTTGTIFTDDEAKAFDQYMRKGGGYVGVHASTDGEYDRPWYARMTGANFNGHPFDIAEAAIAVFDKNHPSTRFISQDTLIRTDEWYFWGENSDFRNNPLMDPAGNNGITVLMALVESSIEGSTLNHLHPICWYKDYVLGRVWYCGFGHAPETFKDPLMVRMLLGGIQYAANLQNTYSAFNPRAAKKRPAVSDFLTLYDSMGRIAGTRHLNGMPENALRAKIPAMTFAKGVYLAVGHGRTGVTLRQRIIMH